MITQSNIRTNFLGLRTEPVIRKNGERSWKINALIDDASTNSYINADFAAELGLQGRTERMTVNVLSGQVETFETKPINVELVSLTGNISTMVSACTVDRVTGNMPVVEWNKFKQQWSHLKTSTFQRQPQGQLSTCCWDWTALICSMPFRKLEENQVSQSPGSHR